MQVEFVESMEAVMEVLDHPKSWKLRDMDSSMFYNVRFVRYCVYLLLYWYSNSTPGTWWYVIVSVVLHTVIVVL